MANDKVTLWQPPDAPILNSFVRHSETVLNLLLDNLGKGSAANITSASLSGLGENQIGSGEMQDKYHVEQAQIEEHRKNLSAIDVEIAELASKSTQIAGDAYKEVKALAGNIDGYLRGIEPKPSVQAQIRAGNTILGMTHAAGEKFSQAQQQLQTHADSMAGTQGGHTASQTGYPASSGMSPYLGNQAGQRSLVGQRDAGARDGSSRARDSMRGGEARSAAAQPISAGRRARVDEIYRYLITHYGFTPAQAAGILGNMQVESGFDTGAYNPNEGAIGLCQWEGGRRHMLEQFAAAQGKPVTDWQVQVDYMMSELQGSESAAYARLKATETAGAAASAFDQYYERSSGEARGQRIANANSVAAAMTASSV
ncbi:phage tail tip lysozyme [Nocardia yamanashiensis]|uniref:phage tail tip lysozyme n=1 Tax=Nocardia yamanashiensis TaxID=209247 RepID=UPI0008364435|nr:phage tail tip lysozyme [Nocardia yamanashiensis]